MNIITMPKAKKAPQARLESVTFFCEQLQKSFTVPIDKVTLTSFEEEGCIFGSHGHITLDVPCECGTEHEIIVKEW